MWFNNVRLYSFTKAFQLNAEQLEEKLQEFTFRPCSSVDHSQYGWVSPLGRSGEMMTHALGDYIMICGQKQEKILPAAVIREAVEDKVEELEARQGRKIYRKEKLQIKDDMTATLLPRAFVRTQQTYAYIAPKDNLIVVNATSAAKAEDLLNKLRESIGSLPVVLPVTNISPTDVMTQWLLKQDPAEDFSINTDCELYNPVEDSNVVRCKGQDLYTEEIQAHLAAGKQVKKIGIVWKDVLSCIIADDLTIKRIRFEDMIVEHPDEADAESAEQQFDQDFAVMTLEFTNFFKAFFAVFGGLQEKHAESTSVVEQAA